MKEKLKWRFKNMEIVRRKIEVVFNEEEKQAIKKVINILVDIEEQSDEIIDEIEKQFEEYRYPSEANRPKDIAIDYLGSLIKFDGN